jgi:hypothetical protein
MLLGTQWYGVEQPVGAETMSKCSTRGWRRPSRCQFSMQLEACTGLHSCHESLALAFMLHRSCSVSAPYSLVTEAISRLPTRAVQF